MKCATYIVTSDCFADAQVVLRVDLDVLTPELAHEINDFGFGKRDRLEAEGGDVIRAVVRMFGAAAIQHFMGDGGASFGPLQPGQDLHWTADVIQAQGEGWPQCAELGIQIESAEVSAVHFHDVDLLRVDGSEE